MYIYYADETGLDNWTSPDGSMYFKTDLLSDYSKKTTKEITVLCGTSINESDKRKLLVTGKSLRPRCFKYLSKEKFLVHYHTNNNV